MSENNPINLPRDNFEEDFNAWEGDLWDRKRLGIQLTNYVDRLQCGAVLALDARWGEGKTWFVRHWQKHLETTEPHKHNVIYLDAFANDYLEDPFLVISSEITSCLSKDDDVDKSHINTFKEKAAAAYQALLPSLPKVLLTLGLNLISGGVLGTVVQEIHKAGEKAIESATDEIGDKIKESIEAKIESHEADKNTLLAFKQELAQLAEELDKPLVFIVDELDRCRPDFAIRLIERIKHFFDIKNIVFVLVMDKIQFSKVVCHNYGYDEQLGEEYLDKFIDLVINLNIEQCNKFEDVVPKIEKLMFDLGLLIDLESKKLIGLFAVLFIYKKYSLRALVKIIHKFAIFKFENNTLNVFLVYILFNIDELKKSNDTKNFFEFMKKDMISIIEGPLANYKYHTYLNIEDQLEEPFNEEQLNNWVFQYTKSNLFQEIVEILDNDDACMFANVNLLLKANKYELEPGDSEVSLLQGWRNYLHLSFDEKTH